METFQEMREVSRWRRQDVPRPRGRKEGDVIQEQEGQRYWPHAAVMGGGRRSDGRWPWMLFQVWHEEQREGLG